LEGDPLIEPVWKYSLLARRNNLSTGVEKNTRIIFAVPKLQACDENEIDIEFHLNTNTGIVTIGNGTIVDYSIVYDENNLFIGSSWASNPILDIRIANTSSINDTQYIVANSLFSS
jgi:hypothetical protein